MSIDLSSHRGITNFIRLVAAFFVLVSHSFPLSSKVSADHVLANGLLGEIGVSIFFCLSGFFVYRSSINRIFLHYIILRIGRLFPLLVLVNFIAAFILFPICANSTIKTSLTTGSNSATSYFLLNSTLFFGLQAGIAGLFVDLPYPSVVNGSLWTLPIEFQLYLMLGLLAILTKRINSGGAFLVLFVSTYIFYALTEIGVVENGLLPLPTLRLIVIFLTGCFLACFDFKLIRLESYKLRFLAVSLILLILVADIDFLDPIAYAFIIPGLAILPTNVSRLFEFFRNRDYSYGVYLWAFPAQQLIMHMRLADNALSLMMISLPASLILAVISWHLVEKRILIYIRNLI